MEGRGRSGLEASFPRAGDLELGALGSGVTGWLQALTPGTEVPPKALEPPPPSVTWARAAGGGPVTLLYLPIRGTGGHPGSLKNGPHVGLWGGGGGLGVVPSWPSPGDLERVTSPSQHGHL